MHLLIDTWVRANKIDNLVCLHEGVCFIYYRVLINEETP